MNVETNLPARTSSLYQHKPQRQPSPGVFAMSRLRSALGFFAVLAVSAASAQAPASTPAAPQLLPYIITAVAGGGTLGTTYPTATAVPYTVGQACASGSTLTAQDVYGDGCLATQVLLSVPRAVGGDSQGNLFLVDSNNSTIRRVDARTGIITTIAGQGASTPGAGVSCGTGSSVTSSNANGDGCLATQVRLLAPEGLAVDPANNVWFSDYTLGSVRRIDHTTGVITTVVNVAGTPGYRAGNVANPGTVVPAATGQLVHPYGITFDRAGNLYIGDNYNSTVEVVNLQAQATTIAANSIPAGAIFTIAGAGCTYGNSTTGCTTYGKTGNNGPSTAATLDSPYQVAVDNAGNIYIADEYPYDVRVINGSTGILTTFANGAFTKSAAQTRGPAISTSLASIYGVATDALGNVYIAVYDSTTGTSYIDRVDIATGVLYAVAGQIETAAPSAAGKAVASATYCPAETDAVGDGCPGTQATLYKPFQPFVDAAGNVYIADQGNNLIRKVSTGAQFPAIATGKSATQTIDVHYGAGDSASAAQIPAAGFTLGTATCTTNSDTTTDCVQTATFTPTAAGLQTGSYTTQTAAKNSTMFGFSGTGQAAVLAADPGVRAVRASSTLTFAGISADSAGNAYAALGGSVAVFSPTGTSNVYNASPNNAVAVATDPAGNLYAALSSGSVVIINQATGVQATLGSGFTKPSGIAVDQYGNVYVADSSAGNVTQIAAGLGTQRVLASGLSSPGGLAVDLSGNVFAANTTANNVVEITPTGATATLGSGLSSPAAVAVDAAGSVYVADTRNGRIVFIPNEAGTLTTADQLTIATGLVSPSGIAVTGSGQVLAADLTNIYSYTRSASTLAFGNDPLATQLTAPADLVSAGNLPVTLASPYYTAAGNTTDFNLTPTTGPATLASGLGLALTAGFKPTVTGVRTATFTFNSTVLTLTGNGITPVNATTTTIAANPTAGTYGATVAVTFTVAVPAGQPAATGTVTVKVDTTIYTPTLNASGVATLSLTGLSAGSHTITATYTGDNNSSPSTATPVTVTLSPAPLNVTPNSITKAYSAAIPTLTGTLTGVVNGDTIGVTYSTTATATSPLGTYSITATVTGSAASNYTVTVTPGVLTIAKAGTTTLVSSSATAVSTNTTVTLTATVSPNTAGVPTGSVSFYNGSALIATVALTNGSASTMTTFAVGSNPITAVYLGDSNYSGSTSTGVTVVAATPGFNLTGTPSTATVAQGQTALLSFTVTPTFGYTGTITASCANLPATIGCVFSPASITATGTNTSSLIAMSLTTVQPGGLVQNAVPRSNVTYALLPGFALLLGFASRRRKLRGLLALAVSAALAFGLSGCGQGHFATPTPVGTYTITVNVTGTSSASTSPASSFPVTLTVTQ